MTPLDILRPYQREALTDLWGRWGAGAVRVPMVLATGLGKTKIGTRAVWKWRQDHLPRSPSRRDACSLPHLHPRAPQPRERLESVMNERCVITGLSDCKERECELHYMNAPLKLAPAKGAKEKDSSR
jgi:hypothetical protein